MSASRCRAWCFTINNYTDSDITACEDLVCDYIVYGREVGKDGTPHLQGYVYLKNAQTMSALSKKLKRARLERANGTAAQNSKYCSKDDDVVERGEMPKQGKRVDIDGIKELIDGGGGLLECFEANFGLTVRSSKGFEKYIQLKQKARNQRPEVIWRWGESGSGKTRWVYDTYDSVFSKPAGWYDGYAHEHVLLIDDFDEKTLPYKELLKLMDRYAFQGAVKGAFVHINSPVIVITSDKPPTAFWEAGNDLAQVMRRLSHVVEVTWWSKGYLEW